jgi:hypothetical protein
MPQSCNGCGKTFSSPKYRRSHLSQTTNPLCQSERQAFLARHLQNYSPPTSPRQPVPPPLPSSPRNSPTTSTPISFETPFENPPDTSTHQLPDSEDTSSDDASTSSYDGEGEQDLGDQSDEDTAANGDADDDEHGRFLSADEVTGLQGNMWAEVHVEVYPGRHAGAVHSHGIPTMKEFENTLGGPHSNPYAPFNSQTDWELAKWAKLRGPGATAFTELMGVTGVCRSLLLQVPR